MIQQRGFTVYVDHTILLILSRPVPEADPDFENRRATSRLWRQFREGKARLVTCGKETEMDIILWLNRQGCCVTDTLRAMEAIREFENWGKVERDHIQQYKQVLVHYEELELLPFSENGFAEHRGSKGVAELLNLPLNEPDLDRRASDDMALLRQCLADLGSWYTEDRWRDLKRTEYRINWEILESALRKQGLEAISGGIAGQRNMELFGLLNRAIGLSKKSCGRLPMPKKHIDFVINTVMERYGYTRREQGIHHILHCARHGVNLFSTTNRPLVDDFARCKPLLEKHLGISHLDLELVSPSALAHRLPRDT
ncbi:hypothetical protein [Syntrophorhabdus aromaticivorans]|uniref:Uncharacterized protein n=1 Tax=Syntrophorhabdus aromaticivorans TaxID=328301 RepID=A0A351U2K9_9BACT|nr:hypothetical protein [Syntrophorhabdus aromaticivorans]NLW34899.1 hypothetical protein [Syntrophorhabdus aromaticivorans]HBA54190.1 hypothetical protein [Syntrophorhabdus aromaticivorans]